LGRYHDIKMSDATVSRTLRRHGLNGLPCGTRMRKLHTERYQKQVPEHDLQMDIKFLILIGEKGGKTRCFKYTQLMTPSSTNGSASAIFHDAKTPYEALREKLWSTPRMFQAYPRLTSVGYLKVRCFTSSRLRICPTGSAVGLSVRAPNHTVKGLDPGRAAGHQRQYDQA
jgi:hypothetical protein